ncbi:MAG: polyribonucleotide nucleotidyltransferase, partial [Candidatus Omnitrophota bacterium]
MSIIQKKIKFGKEELILETGKIAKQANAAVTVCYGGTVVLVTACASKEPPEKLNYFPLTVEYQEKTYAAGRIPGGFFKREGRPSENEILTARLIDRPIRPLFPKGFMNEVQIMAIVLSSDGENDPDVLSVVGASAALSISDIPFDGPIAACRVVRVDGKFVINPTYKELEKSDLDIVVTASNYGVIMLESKINQVPESVAIEAIRFGYENLKPLMQLQKEFRQACGKEKMDFVCKRVDEKLMNLVKDLSEKRLQEICQLSKKEDREEAMDLLSKELEVSLVPQGYDVSCIKEALVEREQEKVRKYILEKNTRIDGRKFDEIRSITCEVGFLPRTHGSSLFTRGQTQSLSVVTLGTSADEQMIEALEGETSKSFMLHYS